MYLHDLTFEGSEIVKMKVIQKINVVTKTQMFSQTVDNDGMVSS